MATIAGGPNSIKWTIPGGPAETMASVRPLALLSTGFGFQTKADLRLLMSRFLFLPARVLLPPAAVQDSPGVGSTPSEACSYIVSPNNMIAEGQEHVLVITDPGEVRIPAG